jgi:hypothetical protein
MGALTFGVSIARAGRLLQPPCAAPAHVAAAVDVTQQPLHTRTGTHRAIRQGRRSRQPKRSLGSVLNSPPRRLLHTWPVVSSVTVTCHTRRCAQFRAHWQHGPPWTHTRTDGRPHTLGTRMQTQASLLLALPHGLPCAGSHVLCKKQSSTAAGADASAIARGLLPQQDHSVERGRPRPANQRVRCALSTDESRRTSGCVMQQHTTVHAWRQHSLILTLTEHVPLRLCPGVCYDAASTA